MSFREDLNLSRQISAAAIVKTADSLDPSIKDELGGLWNSIKGTFRGLGRVAKYPVRNVHPGDAMNALVETNSERNLRSAVEDAGGGFLGTLHAGRAKGIAHDRGLVSDADYGIGDRLKNLGGMAVDHPEVSVPLALLAGGGLTLGAKHLYDKHQEAKALEEKKQKAKDDARVLAKAKLLMAATEG